MQEKVFIIAKDFAKSPGPRFIKEGPNSAEKLMNDRLRSLFSQVVHSNERLKIDLDGTTGYATSFLEATFGGLAREFGPTVVLDHISIKSEKVPDYAEESISYINEVKDRSTSTLHTNS